MKSLIGLIAISVPVILVSANLIPGDFEKPYSAQKSEAEPQLSRQPIYKCRVDRVRRRVAYLTIKRCVEVETLYSRSSIATLKSGNRLAHCLDIVRSDGSVIVCYTDGVVLQWSDAAGMWTPSRIATLSNSVACCAVSPDSRHLVIGHDDGSIQFLTIGDDAQTVVRTVQLTGRINCVRYSPDGRDLFAGCSNGKLQILRLDDKSKVESLSARYGPISGVDSTSDGSWLVFGTAGGRLVLWDRRHKRQVWEKKVGGNYGITRLAISPDDREIAIVAGTKHRIEIRDIKTGETCRDSDAAWANVSHIEYLSDHELLTTGYNGTIRRASTRRTPKSKPVLRKEGD